LPINIWGLLPYALNMNTKIFLKTLGEKIKAVRKSKGLSQEKLAELSGLHPTYISDVERGKVNASIYSCFLIIKALGISFTELINLAGNKEVEREVAVISGLIRELDKKKQKIILAAVHGMIKAVQDV